MQLLHISSISMSNHHLIKYNICMSFKWLIQSKHIKILSIIHLVCEKHKRSPFSTFWKFWIVLNTARYTPMYQGRVPLYALNILAHGQIHGRVATAVHQNYAFSEAATLATKVTTLVTMHILIYNICNTYFSIQNNT